MKPRGFHSDVPINHAEVLVDTHLGAHRSVRTQINPSHYSPPLIHETRAAISRSVRFFVLPRAADLFGQRKRRWKATLSAEPLGRVNGL